MIHVVRYKSDRCIGVCKTKEASDNFYKYLSSGGATLKSKLKALFTAPRGDNTNLHANVYDAGKTVRDFKSQSLLVFDIDLDDKKKDTQKFWAYREDYLDTELVTTAFHLAGLDKEALSIVRTGFGWHVYIHAYDEKLTKEQLTDTKLKQNFLNFAKKVEAHLNYSFKELFEDFTWQWLIDPMSYSPRKMMRLPLSHYKKTIDKQTYECDTEILQVADRCVEPSSIIGTVQTKVASSEASDWEVQDIAKSLFEDKEMSFPVDKKAVEEGCRFLKWTKDNADKVSEPEWYAALSIVGRLDKDKKDNIANAHRYSMGHSNYTEEGTLAKLEQALTKSGPRTCANVKTLWRMADKDEGCAGCPHKVKSPIVIRGEDAILSEANGYYNVNIKQDGSISRGQPNYDDLVKGFGKKHPFLFDADSRELFTYDDKDKVWRSQDKDYPKMFCEDIMNPKPKEAHRKEFEAKIRLYNVKEIKKMEHEAKNIIMFKNGQLNLDSMKLIEHNKEVFNTTTLPFDFNPSARPTLFNSFIRDLASQEEDKALFLKEWMAYCLLNRDCSLEKAVLLLGSGSNGKSSYVKLLQYLVGKDNHSVIGLRELGKAEKRLGLHGSLLNICEEVGKKDLKDVGMFKKLVTGETVDGRALYHNSFMFKNKAKFILTANKMFETSDTTDGYRRRLIICNFNARFVGDNKDFFIVDKLKEEASGIYNELIKAYKNLMNRKRFIMLSEGDTAMEEHLAENDEDFARMFYEDNIVPSKGEYLYFDRLWEAYKEWEDYANIKMYDKLPYNKFKVKMGKLLKGKKTFLSGKIRYRDVALKKESSY